MAAMPAARRVASRSWSGEWRFPFLTVIATAVCSIDLAFLEHGGDTSYEVMKRLRGGVVVRMSSRATKFEGCATEVGLHTREVGIATIHVVTVIRLRDKDTGD